MEKRAIVCPGCGVVSFSENKSIDKDFNASGPCRELMFQLSYYTLSLQDPFFIHQLIVDAYAGQHSGINSKPIAITFALVGLYLVNEKNYTGKQVQLVHMKLARKSKIWPYFSPPKDKAQLTVQDVCQSQEEKKQEMIKKWSRAVWDIWKPEKDKIVKLLDKYLKSY